MDELQRAYEALRRADSAGDKESVVKLAEYIKTLEGTKSNGEAEQGQKETPLLTDAGSPLDNVAQGFRDVVRGATRTAPAGMYHLAGNATDLVGKGAEAVFGPQDLVARGAKAATKALRGAEQNVALRPDEFPTSTVGKINQGVGQALTETPEYLLAAPGGPAAFAAMGGLQEADKGVVPALKGATQGAVLGKVLGATSDLTPTASAVVNSTAQAGMAAGSGDTSDVVASGVTGGLMGLAQKPGFRTLRDVAADATPDLTTKAQAKRLIEKNPRTAQIDAEIVSDLNSIKAGQPDPKESLTVRQANQLQKSYLQPVKDALENETVPLTPEQIRKVSSALSRDRIVTNEELQDIAEAVPGLGPAAADALAKAQRFAQLTKRSQSDPDAALLISRAALDLVPVPTVIRYAGRRLLGADKAREQVMRELTSDDSRAVMDEVLRQAPRKNPTDDLAKHNEEVFQKLDKLDPQGASSRAKRLQAATDAGVAEDHYQGIRIRPSYEQHMRNVERATDFAFRTAPNDALRAVVNDIAFAPTPEKKRVIYEAALEKASDADKQWMSSNVELLTTFGPKTKPEPQPLATDAISRDSSGRPTQRIPLRTDKTDRILDAIAERGFSPNAVAGLGANVQHESAGDPGAIGDGGSSSGLFQWHGPRQEALKAFAQKRGRSWKDTDLQLDFLDHELTTKFPGLRTRLNNAPTPAEAARIFVKEFERPADLETNLRVRADTAERLAGVLPSGTSGRLVPLDEAMGYSGAVPKTLRDRMAVAQYDNEVLSPKHTQDTLNNLMTMLSRLDARSKAGLPNGQAELRKLLVENNLPTGSDQHTVPFTQVVPSPMAVVTPITQKGPEAPIVTRKSNRIVRNRRRSRVLAKA